MAKKPEFPSVVHKIELTVLNDPQSGKAHLRHSFHPDLPITLANAGESSVLVDGIAVTMASLFAVGLFDVDVVVTSKSIT